ncbi:MAG: alpha/beta hydrolase-fold protein [Planctomycetia bacterium]|nr:alpha/beta hydrolase-fold protein [Planctomycetia bacterium]
MLRHSVFRSFCLLIPIYALLCAASLAQDVPNGPEPARGFDARRPQVEYGEMVTIQYYSPVAEMERSANVILPPNYDPEKKYPALYLLHGLGGDQNEWLGGAPNEILSNLLAEKKTQPAIVIIPNVRVRHKDVKTPPPFFSTEHFKEFDAFLEEFQTALKPEIEKRYKIDTRREAQAIAGLSMGGREALHLGVKLAEQFGYVGAFEPAPGILPYKDENGLFTEDSFQFPENLRDDVYVLVVKGSSDNVVGPWPESYAKALTRAGTDPHFTVYTGGHDFNVWKRSLWLFAQNIFTEKKKNN